MKTAEYDFFLPPGRIAERPAEKRDGSRLMVLHRDGGVEHRTFSDLPRYLRPGDMLILNNSKVFPARLCGSKPTGGRLEMLLVRRLSGDTWSILMKERYTGTLIISETLIARVSLGKTARFEATGDVADLVWRHGKMPLPPYIKRTADETDMARYQTVYAEVEGSIAAPTAGLHFTEGLLDVLREKSVRVRTVTLHVGTGTFRPIRAQAIADHVMDEERFAFDAGLIAEIDQTKNRGDRVVAVGTTTTRTLEGYASGQCSVFSANGTVHGSTGIFIREGYRFRIVDAMITNFHLPCSTPLVLSAAFAGREKLLGAYGKAISGGYRFFSYGDAMLLL